LPIQAELKTRTRNKDKKKAPPTRSKKPEIVGEYEIELNGRPVKYTLKRSRLARLVWLKINATSGLSVTVPFFYSCEELPGFLCCRSGWILRHLEKYQAQERVPDTDDTKLPAKFPFLGKYFVLKPNSRGKGFTAESLDPEVLDFNLRSAFGEPSRQGLKRWLREQAARTITEKVKTFSSKMGVDYHKVFIRDQRSRWGSCSARKNLSFNWRLIMAPESVIDYVIVHELCHLKEMNHSKTFWKAVNEYCPEWRQQRKWLNEHCDELNAQLSLR
jgi:predicted metal-dependent hydrolase